VVGGLLRHWRKVPRADAKAEATDEPAHGALLVLSACLALGLRLANACAERTGPDLRGSRDGAVAARVDPGLGTIVREEFTFA
jgi:hypothetical protein